MSNSCPVCYSVITKGFLTNDCLKDYLCAKPFKKCSHQGLSRKVREFIQTRYCPLCNNTPLSRFGFNATIFLCDTHLAENAKCIVCGDEWVDVLNGHDTCTNCIDKV